MKISWSAPSSNSDTITGYRVYIADSTNAFLLESTYCNGLANPVLSNMYCHVPMSVLRASPYSLAFDALVEVKIEAKNSFGYGALSPANTAGA